MESGQSRISGLEVSLFEEEDEEDVRDLILSGLVEHWGRLDPAKNPDLQWMASAYAGATTLVARIGKRIVGTGTLVPRNRETAEIVRMSVAVDVRRRGIGAEVLQALIQRARVGGFRRIVLETTATWQDAVAFYRRSGFSVTHIKDGDVFFVLDL